MRRATSKDIEGTSYQGQITETYARLCEFFGPPEGPSQDGKTQAEWWLIFSDETVVTIYDWKREEPVEEIRLWNVGGKSYKAVELVETELSWRVPAYRSQVPERRSL